MVTDTLGVGAGYFGLVRITSDWFGLVRMRSMISEAIRGQFLLQARIGSDYFG